MLKHAVASRDRGQEKAFMGVSLIGIAFVASVEGLVRLGGLSTLTSVLTTLAMAIPVLFKLARSYLTPGPPKRVLIIVPSCTSGGFSMPAVACASAEFDEVDELEQVFASPLGGKAAPDDESGATTDPVQAEFWNDADIRRKLEDTIPLARCPAKDFAAVFVAGGTGAVSFAECKPLQTMAVQVYEAGGVLGAAGLGVSSLLGMRLSGGRRLFPDPSDKGDETVVGEAADESSETAGLGSLFTAPKDAGAATVAKAMATVLSAGPASAR